MKTYTLLITLGEREPADPQALADRIQCELRHRGSLFGAPYAVAQVDAFEGDLIRTTPPVLIPFDLAAWPCVMEAKDWHEKMRGKA